MFIVQLIFKVSFAANVPLPVVKLAIWVIVTPDDALNKAEAKTDAKPAPVTVKVFSNSVLLVPAECVLVGAITRESPFVTISPVRLVSPAAGVITDSVEAIKLAPTVPAALLVKH